QNIELLEAYLVPQGYEIVKAASGEEALEKLSSNQIELILMDIMMPGMDGFEVTRRIRQDTAHRLIPIILVTALQETEDRVKGIEAGCDDFLSKPVDKMELFARVRSLLQVKAYNDLMSDYQIELEAMVTSRTEELRHTLENLEQEITERKVLEDLLKESEVRYRRLFETAIDGVLLLEKHEGNISRANPATTKLLGYSEDEITGKTLKDVGFPDDFETIQEILQKLEKDGIIHHEDTPLKKKNGQFVDTDIYMVNKAILVQCNIRDITERKRKEEENQKLQAQFIQAQKMESVGRLAGGVAHDFNNMLGVILGHAEFALEKADENHELHADLKEIQTAARRSADLTKQLLAFARKQII
ncbi:MAG: response regulator, partial [Desulfobacteraceae bacterium]|nr:response regulator [Desulfobacteraceae bacterium]